MFSAETVGFRAILGRYLRRARKAFRTLVTRRALRRAPSLAVDAARQAGLTPVSLAANSRGLYAISTEHSHRPAVEKVIQGDVFEAGTLSLIERHYDEGDIVHAGTFFGDFLPSLSRLAESDVIWAFESVYENYKLAAITSLLNDLRNVKLFNVGLGETSAQAAMRVTDSFGRPSGGASMVVDVDVTDADLGSEHAVVEIAALDEVIPVSRRVSIIQLDVEGHEKAAILGALKTIERCRPLLIMEDNAGVRNTAWFREEILGKGYKPAGLVDGNHVFRVT